MDPAAIAAAAANSEASAMLERKAFSATAAELSPAVNHIAVKLPDFWTKEPELWFMEAETTFRCANITCSLTKYDYVLQRLPMDVLVSVKELARRVRAGEIDDPYGQRSPWQHAFDLLDMPHLGDRRLSVLLDTMLASLPDDCQPNCLFMAKFLGRLPTDIRDQLVAQDLKELAAMAVADRIYDARPQGGLVHTVQQVLTAGAHAVNNRSPSPAARRRQATHRDWRRRGQSRRRDDGGDSNGLCFYHTKFGAHASRYRQPCGWPGNGLVADGSGN
jgi:hypothetical protein